MDSPNKVSPNLQPISRSVKREDRGKDEGFLDTLKSYAYHVDRQIKEANQITEEFGVGTRHDLHEIMIASEKADLSYRLLLKIRGKLIEAYQEIMRMQF
jgi:flagellar hook-basal body complex protein FliE